MRKIWAKLKQAFQAVVTKISNFSIGTVMILGALLGIKRTEDGKYNTNQIVTAGWTFMFGIPIILLFFPSFPIQAWAMIIITCIMLVNLDEALMLFYLFSEHGVRVVNSGDYSQWIQELYYSSTSQSEQEFHSMSP